MPDKTPANATRRLLVRFLVGALFGAGLGFALAFGGVLDFLKEGDWSFDEIVSIALAAALLVMAAYAAFAVSSPARYRRLIAKTGEEEPVDPQELRSGWWQAAVLAIAGILLPIPPILAETGAALELRQLAAGALIVLLLVETAINWRLWKQGDELTRSVIVLSGAASFWILQLLLFGWASLAKLALVPDISSWTALVVTLSVYLMASVTIGLRKGIAEV